VLQRPRTASHSLCSASHSLCSDPLRRSAYLDEREQQSHTLTTAIPCRTK
jgi:hypothetical protein